jgi:COP9 signalosome complex subunit 6
MASAPSDEKTIFLHPLTIVGVSSMYTRRQVQKELASRAGGAGARPADPRGPRLLGGLLGRQVGREYHLCDKFEFPYDYDAAEGTYSVDTELFDRHLNLVKMVHLDWEVLGWFSVGPRRGEGPSGLSEREKREDAQIHRTIREAAGKESFLFMHVAADVGTEGSGGLEELPISLFCEDWRDDSSPTRPLAFKMQSGRAEGVAMDHVSRVTGGDGTESQFVTRLRAMQACLRILNERVGCLRDWLESVRRDPKKRNARLLRQIAAVCGRLPVIDSDAYRTQQSRDHGDAMLVSYLAAVTKAAGTVNAVIDKARVAQSGAVPGGRRRGARGPGERAGRAPRPGSGAGASPRGAAGDDW